MVKPERVKSAPGLVWKTRANGVYEARWQARTDLVKRGYPVKSVRLWTGTGNPTIDEWNMMSDVCHECQQEMLVWGRGGLIGVPTFNGTLSSLMDCYRQDTDSPFHKLRYSSRSHYEDLIRLLRQEHGEERLESLKARTFLRWHETWTTGTKLAIGHSKIAMLRILFSFGASILEDPECQRLSGVLSKMRFPTPKPRTERLTAQQANAIRAKARQMGRSSISLAQSFQFELMLRQRDCIGEFVPLKEPGISDLVVDGHKWLRGIRWEEIDQNLTLRHVTSKRQKEIVVSLRNAPMVMEELSYLTNGVGIDEIRREDLPASGPIVISEWDNLPWTGPEYRRLWRIVANACGIPKTVRNMDSRAGAISEATDAGADLEMVRHAATHSNISMTMRYSRGAEEKIASVQKMRTDHRNKPKT